MCHLDAGAAVQRDDDAQCDGEPAQEPTGDIAALFATAPDELMKDPAANKVKEFFTTQLQHKSTPQKNNADSLSQPSSAVCSRA